MGPLKAEADLGQTEMIQQRHSRSDQDASVLGLMDKVGAGSLPINFSVRGWRHITEIYDSLQLG